MPFDLISPDGRRVSIEKPALAVRLRAQGYRDADATEPEPEPELSATEPLHPDEGGQDEEFVLADHVFVDIDEHVIGDDAA